MLHVFNTAQFLASLISLEHLQDSFHNPTLIDYVSATLYKIHSEALEIDIAWPQMNKLAYIKFPYLLMQGVGRDPAYFR